MAEPLINIFLSSVTKELGSHRVEVANALREKGLNTNYPHVGLRRFEEKDKYSRSSQNS